MTGIGRENQRWRMFALSFTALFLELMVIRWVPSVVHLIAFYANLMLLSSFLGLGVGAVAGKAKRQLLGLFPTFLAIDIGILVLSRHVVFGTSAGEARLSNLNPTVLNTLVLITIFVANTLLFVPLGQRIGALFDTLPKLSAYAWDLAGSLFGTLCFGVFSLRYFSPVWGMVAVMGMYFLISSRRLWLLDAAVFAAVLSAMFLTSERGAIWSPYHYVTVTKFDTPDVPESAPPADLLTMVDPPIYSVHVNHFYYHYNLSMDVARYTPTSKEGAMATAMLPYYTAPYRLVKARDRVLVLGAGGGADVEGAIISGARHVDAVEIDPMVVQVSRRFNAGAPYSDPRVTVHVDDARAFLARAKPGYDLVAFGLLDSHALFSSMNNVRLDGYVYTVEGIRTAYNLLNDRGTLSLAFVAEKSWLAYKLFQLVAEATGRAPAVYVFRMTVILCVPKDPSVSLPAKLGAFVRYDHDLSRPYVALPTDDWPFLYLLNKAVPSDYLIAICSLLAISVISIVGMAGRSFGLEDLHFGLLGSGFLLLETKSITDCSLYFGATWLVTAVVVSGVILMVMAANQVAVRLKAFSLLLYAPLFLTLVVLFLVPREAILGFPLSVRLLWTLVAVPLPIFFAGVIFSTTFRDAVVPSVAIGANLIGAMVGGFCEYLAMSVGSHRLSLLVIVAYLGSMLTLLVARRVRSPA